MRLTSREKLLIGLGAAGCAVLLGWQFYLKHVLERSRTLKRVIPERRALLKEVTARAAELRTIEAELTRLRRKIAARKEGFALLSFLEQTAKGVGLGAHIAYIKPSTAPLAEGYIQSIAEIKLEAIRVDQLMSYLRRIESAENIVGVKSMNIALSRDSPNLLDVTIQASTMELQAKPVASNPSP